MIAYVLEADFVVSVALLAQPTKSVESIATDKSMAMSFFIFFPPSKYIG